MVLGFRRTKVAASGTLLGGDPVRLDGRSNLANRLATEEAQLDWRLQFLALVPTTPRLRSLMTDVPPEQAMRIPSFGRSMQLWVSPRPPSST